MHKVNIKMMRLMKKVKRKKERKRQINKLLIKNTNHEMLIKMQLF